MARYEIRKKWKPAFANAGDLYRHNSMNGHAGLMLRHVCESPKYGSGCGSCRSCCIAQFVSESVGNLGDYKECELEALAVRLDEELKRRCET